MTAEFEDDVEFEEADQKAGVVTAIVETEDNPASQHHTPSNMMEYRKHLVRDYHGANSLSEKLAIEDKNNPESMVMALVGEMIGETDHLLGNELLAGEQGNIRDASVISAKRADVIRMAIAAVQTKQAFDKDNGINVNSPSMRVVFRFFMKKVRLVFNKLNYDDEASDLFFATLSSELTEWDKELKKELDNMNSLAVRKDG